MLSFFRRFTNSRAGVIITFIVLGVIALAFAAGDVTGLAGDSGGGLAANDVAKVGKADVTVAALRNRVQTEFDAVRQQQPTLDIAGFASQGGIEGALDRLVSSLAFEQFGTAQGMTVSKRTVDGQIASVPGLQGPTGKFDPQLYEMLLQQRRLTDAEVRRDIVRDTITQNLILPTIGAGQVPGQLALPYASLLLERRQGQVGFIPTSATTGGPAPTDAELTAFYGRNLARYTVPERRAARFALVSPASVAERSKPSDQEVAQYYNANRARYAATERRTVSQVVVADQAQANALAIRIKGGTPVAAAARAIGLEAQTSKGIDKAGYAAAASTAAAEAVFAAPSGGSVGPIRAPLGFVIAHVDAVEQVPGKSLDQARPEIAAALTKQKTLQALSAVHDAIDDALSENGTFAEIVADQKLAAERTPALLSSGVDPDAAGTPADPARAPIVQAAFAATAEDDAPQLVPIGQDGSFALVAIDRIVPAAPKPLGAVRADVARDFAADRARQAARKAAVGVVAQLNRGAAMQQALGATGLRLDAPRPLAASRAQLAAAGGTPPAPLVLLFSMAERTAKLLEAPDRDGWYVIKLDRIARGDASRQPQVVAATRADLARLVGREYVEQFARAVRADVGVRTDPAAIARVRADLTGQGGSNN